MGVSTKEGQSIDLLEKLKQVNALNERHRPNRASQAARVAARTRLYRRNRLPEQARPVIRQQLLDFRLAVVRCYERDAVVIGAARSSADEKEDIDRKRAIIRFYRRG